MPPVLRFDVKFVERAGRARQKPVLFCSVKDEADLFVVRHDPAKSELGTTANSACFSVAPRSRKRSKASFSTWIGRALARSILLMTSMAWWPRLQRLAQHELGLRHRSVYRVDQDQHAVYHVHHALDLAAEVGMAGCVYNVDLVTVIDYCGILRHDRDAALAFQVVRVHYPLGHLLVIAKDMALPEHGIDQGGFAVVYMCYDCYVPDIVSLHLLFLPHKNTPL